MIIRPLVATCFDLSKDADMPLTRQAAADLLGRDVLHGDVIKLNRGEYDATYAYVVDGMPDLLEDRNCNTCVMDVPLEVTEGLADAMSHYRYFKWQTIALGRDDVHIRRVFVRPSDVLDRGTFRAIRELNGGAYVDSNIADYRDQVIFFLSVQYAGCYGNFEYFERSAFDQAQIEAYFEVEVERKRQKDDGIVTLTLDHCVSYKIDDGDFRHWRKLPLTPETVRQVGSSYTTIFRSSVHGIFQKNCGQPYRQAFPSDLWSIVDPSPQDGLEVIVKGRRPELDLFSSKLVSCMGEIKQG